MTTPAAGDVLTYVAPNSAPSFQTPSSSGGGGGVSLLNANGIPVGNVGGGEDTLMSYALPANTLSAAGKGVRIRGWGIGAANVNAKSLQLYFGSSILTVALYQGVAFTDNWLVEAVVLSSGVDTQTWETFWARLSGATADSVAVGATAEDDGAPITIKFTGTATSNDDIVQQGMVIELFDIAQAPVVTGVALLSNRQPSGTGGGTATSGSWGTNPLNTVESDPSSIVASFGSDQFVLHAGTYRINAFSTFYGVNLCQPRIFNVTDNIEYVGTPGKADGAGVFATTIPTVTKEFTISGDKTFELQYQVQTTEPTIGLGLSSGFGSDCIFAFVQITKVA